MLAFERVGHGVPLVFIHAFPLSRRMWALNKEALSKNFQFISVDLPGFGESALTNDTSTMEFMACEVVATLDSIGVKEKFIATGVSMGGYVLFQIAKLFPERLRALGFVSTRSAADTPEGREKRMQTIALVEREGVKPLSEKMMPQLFGNSSLEAKLPIVDEVKSWIQNADPRAVCAALRGMAVRPDSTPFLPQISVPSLVISGAEDIFIRSAEMEILANGIKVAEYHVFPRSGHLLTLEKPDQFSGVFLQFLKRRVL